MATILTRGGTRTRYTYAVSYTWNDCPGAGFSFDSDEDGNIFRDQLKPAGLANLEKCESGEHDVSGPEIVRYVSKWYEPTAIRCQCRNRLELRDVLTNRCRCNRWYNGNGQELAPPDAWEPQDRYDVFGPQKDW